MMINLLPCVYFGFHNGVIIASFVLVHPAFLHIKFSVAITTYSYLILCLCMQLDLTCVQKTLFFCFEPSVSFLCLSPGPYTPYGKQQKPCSDLKAARVTITWPEGETTLELPISSPVKEQALSE